MMKNTALFVVLVITTCAAGVFGQSTRSGASDMYLISARAGGVNYVQGAVAIARIDGTGGSLIKGDTVEIGERISTGEFAKAEILLNPGSYMRIGPGSEFEFITTGLDDLQIKLRRGNAIFEVFATDDFRVTVLTPKGRVSMIDSGVYRVDVRPGGSATVSVTEGKAQIGNSKTAIIKAGRVGTIGESVAIAKFDRGKRDEMDEWSRSRAKDLAKVTASLKQKDIRASLINSFNNRRWGMYDSFGLWIFNPYFGGFSFLPFGNRWNSPYGFGFGYGMDWGTIPWWNRFSPPIYGTPGGTAAPPKQRRPGAIVAPPYTAVERHSNRQPRTDGTDNSQSAWPSRPSSSSRSAEPGFSPPSPAPARQSEPSARPATKVRSID